MLKPKRDDAPLRTCVGCGANLEKGDLLRFVLDPQGRLVPDLKGRLPGRGAYTCLIPTCVAEGVKRRKFSRSFKSEVLYEAPVELVARVAEQMVERVAGYLSLANRAGKVVSGSDAVTEALRKGRKGVLFIATDVARESGEKFGSLAERGGVETVHLFSRDRLGGLLGKEQRTVALVDDPGFAASISGCMGRYRNFFNGGVDTNE